MSAVVVLAVLAAIAHSIWWAFCRIDTRGHKGGPLALDQIEGLTSDTLAGHVEWRKNLHGYWVAERNGRPYELTWESYAQRLRSTVHGGPGGVHEATIEFGWLPTARAVKRLAVAVGRQYVDPIDAAAEATNPEGVDD